MTSFRALQVFLFRRNAFIKIAAFLGFVYVLLNILNVEKINYDMKHQPEEIGLEALIKDSDLNFIPNKQRQRNEIKTRKVNKETNKIPNDNPKKGNERPVQEIHVDPTFRVGNPFKDLEEHAHASEKNVLSSNSNRSSVINNTGDRLNETVNAKNDKLNSVDVKQQDVQGVHQNATRSLNVHTEYVGGDRSIAEERLPSSKIDESAEGKASDIVNDKHEGEKESFMIALERSKSTETFEVDLNSVHHSANVTFPPFVENASPDGPGEGGKKFEINPNDLSERLQKKEDYKIHFFDLWITRKISVRRKLPEARTAACLNVTYDFRMPTVSVVITFYNEAWSTLLRSVHSVLDRSPPGAITEIILLDDCSNLGHLKEPLERYFQSMKIIRIVRGIKRLGLIKARNLGFMYSKGEIIVFLDSHIECFDGWLEPLIQPIMEDFKVVTFPVIDAISKTDFGVSIIHSVTVGSLNPVTLAFTWRQKRNDGKLYHDSPTMPGGLYAISRKWFQHLGAYDPDLYLWGAENMEISIKIWMCGGAIRTSDCSHVAHVFRSQSPLKGQHSSTENFKNTVRIAEVWMDSYKHLYYEKTGYNLPNYGNVTERKLLREKLQCHDFNWYMDHVNPELKEFMDIKSVYAGQIANEGTGSCLQDDFNFNTCNPTRFNQVWNLRTNGYLVVYNQVIASLPDTKINTQKLDQGQHPIHLIPAYPVVNKSTIIQWIYDEKKRLTKVGSHECLDVSKEKKPVLSPCSNSTTQIWHLQTRKELREFNQKRNINIDWNV